MPLTIHVKNFQSLADATLTADGFTVIAGPSNLGKSALIRALTGALFNRPGDTFVRNGHQVAEVVLDGLPGREEGQDVEKMRLLNVHWSKGAGLNQFVIDGDTYAKVGTAAPQVLYDAGYRDVWVGDKDRSRGESIRPQVAEQFDRLFLLDRPGSFVSDVLSVISRLSVLLRAHQRSSTDLKSQKQLLGIRRKDLEAAEAKLDAMAPIRGLHERVTALAARWEFTSWEIRQFDQATALAASRRRLVTFTQQALPEISAAASVPGDLGQDVRAARILVARRQAIVAMASQSLPAAVNVPEAWPLVERVARLTTLVQARQRAAATMAASALAPAVTYPLAKVDHIVERIQTLRRLVQDRTRASAVHFDAVRAAMACKHDEQIVRQELSDLLATMTICPLCERPLLEVSTGVGV